MTLYQLVSVVWTSNDVTAGSPPWSPTIIFYKISEVVLENPQEAPVVPYSSSADLIGNSNFLRKFSMKPCIFHYSSLEQIWLKFLNF